MIKSTDGTLATQEDSKNAQQKICVIENQSLFLKKQY